MHNAAISPASDMALITGSFKPRNAEDKATERTPQGGEGGGGGLGVDTGILGVKEGGIRSICFSI